MQPEGMTPPVWNLPLSPGWCRPVQLRTPSSPTETSLVADSTTIQRGNFCALSITTGVILRKYSQPGASITDQYVSIREAIRNYHPDYRVTSYSWPSYLYRDGRYDPKNPTNGLFKGELLVKVCTSMILHIVVILKPVCRQSNTYSLLPVQLRIR